MKTLAREGDRAELLHRLTTLRPDNARRWGRMTPHQMVCHLNDAFRMSLGEKPVTHVGGLKSLLFRTVIRWMALYLPARWPPGIVTRPELDQQIGGTRPGAFAADVADLEHLIGVVARQPPAARCPPHPLFGRMSRRTWLRWGYLHVDHHLRQFGV